MLYGVHCEKCYSLREIERNEIILRADIDVTVFPAYTLSAEVTCPASQSTDVTKLSERGNDNVFFLPEFPRADSVYQEQIRFVLWSGNVGLRGVRTRPFFESIIFCQYGNYQYKECLWLIFGGTSSNVGPVIYGLGNNFRSMKFAVVSRCQYCTRFLLVISKNDIMVTNCS